MRSFALLLALVAAAALAAPLLAHAQGCSGPSDTSCGNKLCCPAEYGAAGTFVCANPLRSDDHCGVCSNKCIAPYRRCIDGVCGSKLTTKVINNRRTGCTAINNGGTVNYPTRAFGSVEYYLTPASPIDPAVILRARIEVVRALPSQTYRIKLIQVKTDDSDCDIFAVQTLTTDINGNGVQLVSEPRDPASTKAFIYLWPDTPNASLENILSTDLSPTV